MDEDRCPVSEGLLAKLHKANPANVALLVERLSPETRAELAVFCFRRAHLQEIGKAIGAICPEDDLLTVGGSLGVQIVSESRNPAQSPQVADVIRRRAVTLFQVAS